MDLVLKILPGVWEIRSLKVCNGLSSRLSIFQTGKYMIELHMLIFRQNERGVRILYHFAICLLKINHSPCLDNLLLGELSNVFLFLEKTLLPGEASRL